MTPAEIDQKIQDLQGLVYSDIRDIRRLQTSLANNIHEIQRLEDIRDNESRFQLKLVNLEAQASASYHGGRVDASELVIHRE